MDTPTKRYTHPPCATAEEQWRTAVDVCPVRTNRSIVERWKHHGWVLSTEVKNTSTTHSHQPGWPPTHRPTHPPTNTTIERWTLTHQPTYARRATAIQYYLQQQMGLYTPSLSICRAGISIVLQFHTTPGSDRPVPGWAPFHTPRSPSQASAVTRSPGTQRTDVLGRRGSVVVPRGVDWRSALAAMFRVWNIENIFKDPLGHHYHHHRGAISIQDFRGDCLLLRAHFPKAPRNWTREGRPVSPRRLGAICAVVRDATAESVLGGSWEDDWPCFLREVLLPFFSSWRFRFICIFLKTARLVTIPGSLCREWFGFIIYPISYPLHGFYLGVDHACVLCVLRYFLPKHFTNSRPIKLCLQWNSSLWGSEFERRLAFLLLFVY